MCMYTGVADNRKCNSVPEVGSRQQSDIVRNHPKFVQNFQFFCSFFNPPSLTPVGKYLLNGSIQYRYWRCDLVAIIKVNSTRGRLF